MACSFREEYKQVCLSMQREEQELKRKKGPFQPTIREKGEFQLFQRQLDHPKSQLESDILKIPEGGLSLLAIVRLLDSLDL